MRMKSLVAGMVSSAMFAINFGVFYTPNIVSYHASMISFAEDITEETKELSESSSVTYTYNLPVSSAVSTNNAVATAIISEDSHSVTVKGVKAGTADVTVLGGSGSGYVIHLIVTPKSQSMGGSDRFSLNNLNMQKGDVLNLTVQGDSGDTIQVHFYYTDSDGNYSASLVGGLGGTVLDSNGQKTVSFTAPTFLDSVTVKVVYELSKPSYSTSIDYKMPPVTTTTQATTTKIATTTTATTTKATTTTTRVTTTATTRATTTTVASESTTTETTTTSAISKDKAIVFGVDNFSFLNNSTYFHGDCYHISESMLDTLSKSANNIEWNKIIEKTNGSSSWDGSCYGMSSVEILAKSGLLPVNTIDGSAKKLYDWNAPNQDSNVENIINYYHMLQYSKVFTTKANAFVKRTNESRIDELIKLTSDVSSGGNPVLICFNYTRSASSKKLDGGHAVVGYGVEYGSWTYSGGKYDCRILISDPNISGFDNSTCIYINTQTHKWEIPYYQEKYYSCMNSNQDYRDEPFAQIRFVTNNVNLIDTFGYIRKASPTSANNADSIISINSSSSDFGVGFYDLKSGDINDAECELIFYSGLTGNMKEVSAILPKPDVAYEYFEKSNKAFDTAIEFSNSMFEADVTNGSYAIYQPDEWIEFSGKNSDYTLSMILNEECCSTDWYKLELKGYNGNSAKLSVTKDGYIVSGDSLSEGVFITASNRTQAASLNFMTDAKSAFIYEINPETIGVKLDINGDGIYETEFVPDYVGDINQDSNINVVDIIALQKYLLNINTFTKEQFITADLNLDGSVNVIDIALLKKKVLS